MKSIDVPINEFVLDPRLQMRVTLDFAAIDEYAEHLDELPPCKAVREGEIIWPTDGWHRIPAYQKKGRATVPCFVREGTFLDALVEACGQNSDHGIRRTPEDKRRAVTALLTEPTWADKSNRMVAEACKVGEHLVAKIRSEIVSPEPNTDAENSTARARSSNSETTENSQTQQQTRVGKDGKSRPATVTPKILCERCKRLGSPIKGCVNCKDAKDRANKVEKKPVSKTETKEDHELPKSVRNALADTWHADCARTLSAFRQQCKGAFSWSSWLDASVLDHLKGAEECFLAAIPRKVCPECKGHKSINKVPCQNCRHGGYMAGQA